MWSRLRRRTMAPRRPALFVEQYGLALTCALAVAGGLAVAVVVLVLG